MAFKLVLFVAVCLAQGFAFNHRRVMQRQNGCTNPSISFVAEVDEALQDMDALREEVSMAAMEAYAKGKDVKVAVACFVQQSPRHIKLGALLAKKMTRASVEIAGTLTGKALKYGKRMEKPVMALAYVFTTVPVKMYTFIQNMQFLKAARLMVEAHKVVKENSILLAEAFRDMVAEVPEMADRVEFLAKDIYTTARDGSRVLREAYGKCVEEGGPKRPQDALEESHEDASEDALEDEDASEEANEVAPQVVPEAAPEVVAQVAPNVVPEVVVSQE